MNLLIRGAQILDPDSPHHKSIRDILIQNGQIVRIAEFIDEPNHTDVLNADGAILTIGWFDMRSNFHDPGAEQKEDLESGSQAAMAGGFTDVLLLPNASPSVDTKNAVSYYQKWAKNELINIHSMACISVRSEGNELTEMIDLHHAGAAAFSDGLKPIWHTDIMLKSLQYLQRFNGLLINRPEDAQLTTFAHMNEGEMSTMLGLKGMPAISETLMIERDLKLLEYAGGKLHISMLSSKEGVQLIREAKSTGLKVTCDVGVNYLKYIDADLQDYDTNLKVNPPYRTDEDRKALIDGVLDGTIDVIVSDHNPHDEECKKLEFDLADFGSNNLQGFLPILVEVFGDKLPQVLGRFTNMPRTLLGMPIPVIKEGEDACLTLFDLKEKWTFNQTSNYSKSAYSPLFGQELKGKVKAVFNKGKLFTYGD